MVQRGQEPDVRAVGTDPGPVQGGEDRPCGAEQQIAAEKLWSLAEFQDM
jgi:hypothetical protein